MSAYLTDGGAGGTAVIEKPFYPLDALIRKCAKSSIAENPRLLRTINETVEYGCAWATQCLLQGCGLRRVLLRLLQGLPGHPGARSAMNGTS